MKKILIIVVIAAIIVAVAWFAYFKNHTLLSAEIIRNDQGDPETYRIQKETIEKANKRRGKL